MTPNSDFKDTTSFDVEYLRNGTRRNAVTVEISYGCTEINVII